MHRWPAGSLIPAGIGGCGQRVVPPVGAPCAGTPTGLLLTLGRLGSPGSPGQAGLSSVVARLRHPGLPGGLLGVGRFVGRQAIEGNGAALGWCRPAIVWDRETFGVSRGTSASVAGMWVV
jgi:hypothetical protein